MFDSLTDTLVSLALTVINLFPASPFAPAIASFNDSVVHTYLSYANYIVPIGTMLSILSLWIAGVSTYYVYQLILRWIRLVD